MCKFKRNLLGSVMLCIFCLTFFSGVTFAQPGAKQKRAPFTRKAFTRAEDLRLKTLVGWNVEIFNRPRWTLIAKAFNNNNAEENQRAIKSLKARYSYVLDPEINKEPFTPEEDTQLVKSVEQFKNAGKSPRWISISRTMGTGRTPGDLKQRYKVVTFNKEKTEGFVVSPVILDQGNGQ